MDQKYNKLQAMFSKYGKVGIASYTGIQLANYFFIYALVSNHVDFVAIGKKLNFNTETETFKKIQNLGPFGASYVIYKIIAPVRTPITLAILPTICRKLVK